MIWTNGFIQFKENPKTMFDERGNPIKETSFDWSDFIPCGYEDNTNLTAKSGEKSDFKAQSYSIRIKLQPIKERVKLYDKNRKLLGEFVVKSCNDYGYIDETHFVCSL